MKKVIKNIFEYSIILVLLSAVCFYVNNGIVIKALYMDDLLHWSWFRGINIFEFAFKFYDSSSRYRPVFDAIQYIFYTIVGTNPFRFAIINKVYNSIIALFIYYFIKELNAGRIISFLFSSLYLISHFSYYQIGQGIGSLESDAQFFSLIILFYCLKLTGTITKKNGAGNDIPTSKSSNIKNTIILMLMYFIVSFTHERFMGLIVPITLAIVFSKNNRDVKYPTTKLISFVLLGLEVILICYIRFLAVGKVLPAGTGGTYVEETFSISECIKFCIIQVACILGINIGPEHLVGIDFVNLPDAKVKYIALISIFLILLMISLYLYYKIKLREKCFDIAADLIFLSFIAMCIGTSSVTIRVEMRFIYVSFTASLLYLAYMCGFICRNVDIKALKLIPYLLSAIIFMSRVPIEFKYRTYYDKIYCYVDLKRVNSIYDNTIGKFGVDDILHKKRIYLINKFYGMTNFYAEYFFKIYDKDDVGNKILLVNDISEIPETDIGEDTIVLYENYDSNDYKALY